MLCDNLAPFELQREKSFLKAFLPGPQQEQVSLTLPHATHTVCLVAAEHQMLGSELNLQAVAFI